MKFKAVLSFLSAVVFSAYAILPTANKIQHNSNNSFAEEYCDEIIDNTIIPEITLDSSVNVLADENEEEVALSGECGDNITWKFNEVSNTLEIDGYGKMGRWYNETPAPWYPIKDRIEKILISDEIEDVGQYAFYNCANLKSVSLPESITRIDPYCFYMCPLLSDVVIPDNVWYIGAKAFGNCKSLTEVNLTDSLTDLGMAAFSSCVNLTSVDIPSSISSILADTFYNCKNLEEVIISESVEHIDGTAFCGTQWLENLQEKNPFVVINNILVNGQKCTGDVVIPDNVTEISCSAFYLNKNLTSVVIPDSVTEMGDSVFEMCSSLKSVRLSNNLKEIKKFTFSYCTSLTEIDIPFSVRKLESYTFGYGTSLDSIIIRNPVCSINDKVCTFLSNAVIYGEEYSTAKALAEKYDLSFEIISESNRTDTAYTYEIIPLLEPFNEYFYVKTDDPDPSNIRFYDKESSYSTNAYIELCSILFADVVYEDESTYRVDGGYIFQSGSIDGGEITMQVRMSEWTDIGLSYNLPELCNVTDYLIDNYASEDDFFSNMDKIQSGFKKICLYSGSSIRGTLYKSGRYYGISNSPYIDQYFYIQTPYRRKDEQNLFASALYPFRYTSLGFPGTLASVAKKLDSNVIISGNPSSHAYIDITLDGTTKTYGGAGKGEGQGIEMKDISCFFDFKDNIKEYSLEELRKILDDYSKLEIPSDLITDDQLTWQDVYDSVGDGSWISMISNDQKFAYMYKGDDENKFSEETSDTGQSIYWGGSIDFASNCWFDGRYIDSYEAYVPGETFDQHPKAAIILTDVVVPVIDYKYTYKDNKIVYIVDSVEECRDTIEYYYDSKTDTWQALLVDYECNNVSRVETMVEQGVLDEKYLDSLIITREEAEALKLDRNTNTPPDIYLLYDMTDVPGTKVHIGDANCDDEVNISDAVLIMQSTANPNKYSLYGTHETHLTKNGMRNADVNGGGVTNSDACEIQCRLLDLKNDFN